MDVSEGRGALVFLCFLGHAPDTTTTTTTTNNALQDELRALSRDLEVSISSSSSSNNNIIKDHGGSCGGQELGSTTTTTTTQCDPDSGEELETDGHLPSNIRAALLQGELQAQVELQPQVDLQGPGNLIDPESLRALTAELRAIADQFEQSVVMRATDSLAKKLSNSTTSLWKAHLTVEVEWVVKHSGRFNLPQEMIMMALALTLVKGVCEKTPQMLRDLFQTTLQYFR